MFPQHLFIDLLAINLFPLKHHLTHFVCNLARFHYWILVKILGTDDIESFYAQHLHTGFGVC